MTGMVLYMTDAPSVALDEVHSMAALLKGEKEEGVVVMTSSGRLQQQELPKSSFSSVISKGGNDIHSVVFLSWLFDTLKPGGKLYVASSGPNVGSEELKKNMILSGFTEVGVADEGLEAKKGLMLAKKPMWEAGTKAAINIKKKKDVVMVDKAEAGAATWKLDSEDAYESGLIDEDELLTEEDLLRPVAPKKENGDCGSRKACANCTCGRAEGGQPKKLTKEMLENPQPTGGCGSCALGDAFRCGTCPYRGLPAFEPGKKIEVPADFLIADA